MKLVLVTAAAVITGIGPVYADDTTALFQKYRCYVCHADNTPGTGPAFAEVATIYRGKPKAVTSLVALIKQGAHSGGPWHMPPHPEVSDADAAKMARYILSLKD